MFRFLSIAVSCHDLISLRENTAFPGNPMTIRSKIIAAVRSFPGCAHWSDLPAFCGAAAFAAGIVATDFLPVSYHLPTGRLYVFLCAVAIGSLAAGVLGGTRRVGFVAFFIGGMAVALLHRAGWEKCDGELVRIQSKDVHLTGDLCSAPAPRRDRFVWLLKLRTVDGCNDSPLCGRIFRCLSTVAPDAAGSVSVKGRVGVALPRRNRYDFDERALFRANGIAGTISVT
jgi:hypothetical protein